MVPTLIINPRSDEEFDRVVSELAGAASHAHDLEQKLRGRYPRAVVRPRDLSGETKSVWYVYRDGSWTSGDGTTEG